MATETKMGEKGEINDSEGSRVTLSSTIIQTTQLQLNGVQCFNRNNYIMQTRESSAKLIDYFDIVISS